MLGQGRLADRSDRRHDDLVAKRAGELRALAELIEAFFRDGESYGVAIDYYREREPLGTVGALALIDGLAQEDVLVMNGDVLTDIDYGALLAQHRGSDAAARNQSARTAGMSVPARRSG